MWPYAMASVIKAPQTPPCVEQGGARARVIAVVGQPALVMSCADVGMVATEAASHKGRVNAQISAYITHKNLVVRKIMEAVRKVFAKSEVEV